MLERNTGERHQTSAGVGDLFPFRVPVAPYTAGAVHSTHAFLCLLARA